MMRLRRILLVASCAGGVVYRPRRFARELARSAVPDGGILRGRVQVVRADDASAPPPPAGSERVVLAGGDVADGGWGDGAHPSTALCLEWLSEADLDGSDFWDYGCGSGVLALAAKKLGAARVEGVDVEEEALDAARCNAAANGVEDVAFVHGRSVVPGEDAYDFVCANILIGQLSRPSMVATLALGARPGALLCLCGVRPESRAVLLDLYGPYFSEAGYAERAPDEHGAEYWGTWARVVLRRAEDADRRALLDAFSDAAAG